MDFEWDAAKARANWRKHGVDFADAVGVFDDPFALTRDDVHAREARHVGERIRLISARQATPRERRQYMEGQDDA